MPKYQDIIKISKAQNFSRFLGDTPGNWTTPTIFTQYAQKYLTENNIEVVDYSKDFLVNNGMNLILSVAQGSAQEPKLIHLRYFGRNSKDVDIALVGKGVCFDTGGISLKPASEMYRMRYDMLGAAILLSTAKLVCEMKLGINLTATFPLVENMPGPSATKPGDVFVSMSGKTVEIDNTDAEG